jgi:hypothetical protein
LKPSNLYRTGNDIKLPEADKETVLRLAKKVHSSFGFANTVGKKNFEQMVKYECWVNECAKGFDDISSKLD